MSSEMFFYPIHNMSVFLSYGYACEVFVPSIIVYSLSNSYVSFSIEESSHISRYKVFVHISILLAPTTVVNVLARRCPLKVVNFGWGFRRISEKILHQLKLTDESSGSRPMIQYCRGFPRRGSCP